ncbi:MAG: IclR family transcriptional regulator [Clostridiaceae bacterium]
MAIQSVERALEILNLLSASYESLSAIEIGKSLGINRVTAYGLLTTLTDKGYVVKNADTGKYSIGLKLFEIGSAYARKMPLSKVAAPYMSKISDDLGISVHLGILSDDAKVTLIKAFVPLRNEVLNQGVSIPVYASGMGKILLAHLTDDEVHKAISSQGMQKYTSTTIASEDELFKELKKIRQQGYSLDNGEYFDNTYCIAFPIRDGNSQVIASISISGSKEEIENNKDKIILDGLQASKYISVELGWNPSKTETAV